jgi:hypothetical protein
MATSTSLGSVGRATRVTGEVSTTSTSTQQEREGLATGESERRRMGRVATSRHSGIRVQDNTDGVATARCCGGEERAKGIRRFFRMVGGDGEWMSSRWDASRPIISTVRANGRPIPSSTVYQCYKSVFCSDFLGTILCLFIDFLRSCLHMECNCCSHTRLLRQRVCSIRPVDAYRRGRSDKLFF